MMSESGRNVYTQRFYNSGVGVKLTEIILLTRTSGVYEYSLY